MSTEHIHKWTYLRQEIEASKQWGARIHERKVFDVFFCEECLEYRRAHIRTEEQNSESLGWRTTWRVG